MNVKGVVVAKSVADLHSDANNLGGDTSLTEKGAHLSRVTSTTSSPARRRTERCRPVMRHAATGPAPSRTAGRWLAITTSRAAVPAPTSWNCRAQFERLLAAESHRHGRKRILLLLRELKRGRDSHFLAQRSQAARGLS
jgi:hypothetical protein